MKQLFQRAVTGIALFALGLASCQKICPEQEMQQSSAPLQTRNRYSTAQEFKSGITQVVNLVQQHNIVAYLDTLPDGYPNRNGRKEPLANFGYSILEKLNGNSAQVASAVYDVFHFDEATFSLISYLMKAQMVGDISAQTLTYIASYIPLPPMAVAGFAPPKEVVPVNVGGDCCTQNVCNPKLDILVTMVYKAPCGNYEKKTAGYAANNTLTNMSSGKMYRFDAVISGCPCPGTLTSTVTAPGGASYGAGKGKDGSVTLLPVSSGTYTITFTYVVCGITVTKTFTLGVR
jgi:hypothetical protein